MTFKSCVNCEDSIPQPDGCYCQVHSELFPDDFVCEEWIWFRAGEDDE